MESLQCTEQIEQVPAPPLDEFTEVLREDRPEPKKIVKEQSTFSVLELLRQPQQYCDKLHELNEQGSQRIRRQAFEEAVKLLARAEQMIAVGKTACKLIDGEVRVCVMYNLACAYQGLWTLQKCKKYCENATDQLEQLLRVVPSEQKERWLRLALFLLKLRLQHCAILSQLGHHQRALETSKLGLKLLQECVLLIYEFAMELQRESSSSKDQPNSSDKVAFAGTASKFVQLLRMLLDNLRQEITAQTVKKPILYYWKTNPENNERLLKQQFSNKRIFTRQQQVRSLLGVHSETDWIEEFNIGTIMHMSSITYKELRKHHSLLTELTKKNLYDKVIYCSVVHFTIATEIRFIEDPTKNKEPRELKKIGDSKSEAYKVSQLYHLKAIEIMCQGISTCSPYLNHLISSYYKHYLHSLGPIEEHENSLLEDNRSSRNPSIQPSDTLPQQMLESMHRLEYFTQGSQGSQLQLHQQSPIPNSQPPVHQFLQHPLPIQLQTVQSEILQRSMTNFPGGKSQSKAEEPPIDSEPEDEQQQLLQPTTSRHRTNKKKSKLHEGRSPSKSRFTRRSHPDEQDLLRAVKSMQKPMKKHKPKPKPDRSRSPPPNAMNYTRSTNTNKQQKLPLSMLKKAFQGDKFNGMTPSSVQLTQNTTTHINVVLKKKK